MSTVLHPVGPQRARVYWVRRLLVVLLIAALVILAGTAVSWFRGRGDEAPVAAAAEQPQRESADAESSESTGAEAGDADAKQVSDEATEEEEEDAAEEDAADDEADEEAESSSAPLDCAPEALQLTLASTDVSYEPAANPVLTATVTNIGDVPCTVDAGDASREVLISSGDDRIWSSKDCATEETASRQLLLKADGADAVPIEWTRVRSALTCPPDLPRPMPGTYQAVATLGELSSQTVVFILE
jgi:FlaG/FlaF family flagellin (archaellin)